MGTQESQNITAGEYRTAEMKKDLKNSKAKKIKKGEETGSGIREGSKAADGEDCSRVLLGIVERRLKTREMNKTIRTEGVEEYERKSGEGISVMKNTIKERKKHKVKRKLEDVDFEKDGELDGKEAGQHIQNCERKKRKKEKKKSKDNSSLLQQEKMQNNVEGDMVLTEPDGSDDIELKRKKKGEMKKVKPMENGLNDTLPNKSDKKVRFSGQNEVFPILGNSNINVENVGGDGLVRGKWFSPEEDETVKSAVLQYIEKNDLGDEGLDMVLNCSKYPTVRRCWKEIGTAIPYRPYRAVYARAQNLFCRSEVRKWTQEEYDWLRSYHKEHGNKWKAMADELGKHSLHVCAAWSRIKLNTNKGHWSQDETQKLFDLVHMDLQAKLSKEKKSKHGMLRDNICWTAISEVVSTRSQKNCCNKWYRHLTSRMVKEGVWADKDDYRLIDTLYGLDATCKEDVDWDVLLDNRAGDVCKRRWNQMVLHIGHHRNKSFSEQVEVLAKRYCPILLEARETWDNKPRVG